MGAGQSETGENSIEQKSQEEKADLNDENYEEPGMDTREGLTAAKLAQQEPIPKSTREYQKPFTRDIPEVPRSRAEIRPKKKKQDDRDFPY